MSVVIRFAAVIFLGLSNIQPAMAAGETPVKRPNILIAIADDQSFKHTSIQSEFLRTPNFERIANEGFLFNNAYAGSTGCSPSRAALLTGRHHWMIGPAGTHGSSFPAHYQTFVDLLEEDGYKVGFTGKGWGPGDWLAGGRTKNPAGVEFNEAKLDPPKKGISKTDYAANFRLFLSERNEGEPFYFWYGAHEPHLPYAEGPQNAERQATVEVPGFLPDTEASRTMLLDYADEIAHFDDHLGKIIAQIEEAGELDNTLIIVTADNGMPMPRAKSNGYDFGIHVPMAIRWGKGGESGQVVDAPVGFVDLSATILDIAGIPVPDEFVGDSLQGVLSAAEKLDYNREVYSGRERHSSSRYRNLSFPQRMLRSGDYLVIWNAKPDLWPAGAPQELIDGKLGPPHGAYYDIDDSVIKREVIGKRDDPYISTFFHLAVDKRPEWQMFNVVEDPYNLIDLALDPNYADKLSELQIRMMDTLKETGDPRVLGYGHVWEDYPRMRGPMRQFPKLE